MTSCLYNLYEALSLELVQISKKRIHCDLSNQLVAAVLLVKARTRSTTKEETWQRSLPHEL